MKNVTIALDDDSHRMARIYAAEHGTSLSALVKNYLQSLVDGAPHGAADSAAPLAAGNRLKEMPMPFKHQTISSAAPAFPAPPYPSTEYGITLFTKDGKPRQPGAMRGQISWANLPDEWPKDISDSFAAWPYDDPDFNPLPFDKAQLFPPSSQNPA